MELAPKAAFGEATPAESVTVVNDDGTVSVVKKPVAVNMFRREVYRDPLLDSVSNRQGQLDALR